MSATITDPMRQRTIELAGTALHAAQLEDWKGAGKAAQAINDECGGEWLAVAIAAWCDSLIVKQHDTGTNPQGVPGARPMWQDLQTGDITSSADDVPPAIRWGGQLVAARAALDRDMFEALLQAIPGEPGAVNEYVGTLLTSIAMTLNELARREGAKS